MRIGGIASGMDTEQMVKDLMRVERLRVDRYFQQEQRLKWKQEAYTEINRKMANFILDSRKAFGLTTTTSTGVLVSSSVNNLNWVKKATSSNESIVKATTNASAMAGNHTIKVKQLADVARTSSEKLTGEEGLLDSNFRFKAEGSFTINGKTITIKGAKVEGKAIENLNFSDSSEAEGEDKRVTLYINGAKVELDQNYTDQVALKDAIQNQLNDFYTEKNIDPRQQVTVEVSPEGELKFTSDYDIVIDSSDNNRLKEELGLTKGTTVANNSMDYLVKEINKDSTLGLRAAFDKDIGKLMITTKESGDNKNIKITTDIAGMFTGDVINEGVKGKDAIIDFNGEEVKKSTNNFSVFGINLQLQSEQLAEAEPITIRVETDVDSIYDKVKNFVDEYNKLVDEINKQVNQKYYRDFPPLTNEQKEAMTEKDIELWEEKSKSGLLKGDSALTRTLQRIRSGLYETVENVAGSYNHITQIGITTGTYQDGGKLVIDEQKLRNAINNDADGVIDLLLKSPDSALEGQEKLKDSGLVQRIYDGMIDGMKEVIRQSGPGEDSALLRTVRSNILIDFVTKQSSISVLGRDLSSLNSRIFREEELLSRKEDRYWAQFTAMEKALSQMQSQSSWLMAQLGMGQQY